MATDEIKIVRRVYKDSGDYMARCPHCNDWMILEADDMSELRGEQFIHKCDGWMEVDTLARFAGRMPDE